MQPFFIVGSAFVLSSFVAPSESVRETPFPLDVKVSVDVRETSLPIDVKISVDVNQHGPNISRDTFNLGDSNSTSRSAQEKSTQLALSSSFKKTQTPCKKQLDLYFVIGCGLSCPGDEVWRTIIRWVAEAVSHFQLDDEHARATVVQWGAGSATVPCTTHRSLGEIINSCVALTGTTMEELKKRSKAGDAEAQKMIRACVAQAKKDIDAPRPLGEVSAIGNNFKHCLEQIPRNPSTAGHLDAALRQIKGGKGKQQKIMLLADERHHYPQKILLAAKALEEAAECEIFEGHKQCIVSVAVGQDKLGMIPSSFALASEPKHRNFFVVRTDEKQYEEDKHGNSTDVRLVSTLVGGGATNITNSTIFFYKSFTDIVKPILASVAECAEMSETL